MTLARARVHSEFSPGNALRHRDIPKRYILTFLKRDGHVRTYVHTYIRTPENRSNLALMRGIIMSAVNYIFGRAIARELRNNG